MPIKRLFPLGQTLITPGAMNALSEVDVHNALVRHMSGDWGDLDEEDKLKNDFSVTRRLRIFSAYTSHKGEKFWVITEADRSATTILLPSEY